MRMRSGLLLVGLAIGCGAEDEGQAGDDYTPETLTAYRSALPQRERLSAGVPELDEPTALTARGDAVLGAYGVGFARAVNRPVRALVATLRAIADLPPTHFDAAARTFTWGPWEAEDGGGQVALLVKEDAPGADFQYSYALIRSIKGNPDSATPVISGGATPDADDPERGVGVALWDIEAERQFRLEQGDGDVVDSGRGRFVTLFGHHEQEEGDAYFNLAVFRDFVPAPDSSGNASETSAEPIDVDYFYGRVDGDAARIDFLDSDVLANICADSVASCFGATPPPSAIERFEYNAFFVNGGVGRAEARLSEGDLNETAHFVECWSAGLARTSFQIEESGAMVETLENGSCTAPADQSAPDLGVPTLDDVDRTLLGLMSCAAENGQIGCD